MRDEVGHYYREATDKRLERIEQKLDVLIAFRWQVIGGAMVTSAFVATVVQIILNGV